MANQAQSSGSPRVQRSRYSSWLRAFANITLLRDVLAGSCSLLTVACWLVLYRWYSLFDHYSKPGFAFDKIPGHFSSKTLQYTTLLFLALNLIYISNALLIRNASSISMRLKLVIIVTIVASGVLNILIYPVGAIDVFYYLAELKLAYYYHQNPYLVPFVPSFGSDPFAKFGWPLHVPLAYGPAWLLISRLPTVYVGFNDLLWLMLSYKAFSFILLMLSGFIIYKYHDDDKRGWLGVYLLLANPLVLFEAVANAHNDLMMAFFLLAAVLALKRRSWLALPLLAISALIKVFALVLVPFCLLEMLARKWSVTKLLLSILLAFAVAVAIIAPFWSSGQMLQGMRHGMTFASNLPTASIFSFVSTYFHQQHASASTISAVRFSLVGLFAIASLLVIWKVKVLERVLVFELLLFYTLVGSIQPWYLVPVIALLALKYDWVGFGYLYLSSAFGLAIYLIDVWARFDSGLQFVQRHLLGMLLLNVPVVGFLWLQISFARRNGSVANKEGA